MPIKLYNSILIINNVIHAVQKKRRPLYCLFDIEPKLNHHKSLEVRPSPYETIIMYYYTTHPCPQAVVLEGKYWKRKESAVATEYRKWRLLYHKKNVS